MESATQGKPDIEMMIVARREALSMATDDDSGLWELLWELRTRYPDVDASTSHWAAQFTLLSLVLDGLVTIVKWDIGSRSGSATSLDDAVRAVLDDANWSVDSAGNGSQFRFRTTDLGENTYFQLRKLAS